MSRISVLILTYNEQNDIERCLDCVKWSDDVHVLDSFSSDKTVELAQAKGAIVTQRKFDGYASQRNAGLQLPFKHEWLMILDADEIIPEPLRQEMFALVEQNPENVAACRIRRRDIFFGTWLKHAQLSAYYLRLVRPKRVHYEREINEVLRAEGDIHEMREMFDHYPFSKGISQWVDKHNRYSSMEAVELVRQREAVGEIKWGNLLSRDFNLRREAQKAVFYRMPGRPIVKWIYMMTVRRCFLDGKAGIIYAFLMAFYEFLIEIKAKELKRGGTN